VGTTVVVSSAATKSFGDTLSSTLDVDGVIAMWLFSLFAAGVEDDDDAPFMPTSQKDLKHLEHIELQLGLA